jgi:hypothetical protein
VPLLLALVSPVLPAAGAAAAAAYVSDELVLGVYAEQNNQGERLATLHSGSGVETLRVDGEFTEIQLRDGSIGWVKSAYLTTTLPATARVKQLEEELDRSRATTPALAEAAAHSEVEQLKRELASRQSDVAGPLGAAAGIPSAGAPYPWGWVLAVLLAVMGGFWLGHATLARHIKHKFGGIKVY